MSSSQGKQLEGIVYRTGEGAADRVRSGGKTRLLPAWATEWSLSVNDRLLDWYGIVFLVVLWELGPRQGWIDSQFFPPPSAIVAEALKMAQHGELLIQITSSLKRLLQGLLAALAFGIPLGFLLGGWFPRLTTFLRPLLRLLGQINAFSLFPLFVLFFGIGELAKFAVIFWSCLWPILFTTIAGVQEVDPLFVKVARSMGGGRTTLFVKVLFPGALPSIFTGIRLGATTAFLMLIAAEMIGASAGLGWLVHNSSVNYVIPRLYLAASIIAFLGMGMNSLLHFWEGRVVRWKQTAEI
ncbi:ABC transporter permease [Geomesophilobacter sediminis]|uniref:ABC transporter permease n=1 Tax=Geomesophilobacter sediminis TaxID=2798584 RepID=A0A8J7LY46_9BACT|nr:ABC transporter permease [Geomesophilobacter sediminis]MBJ6724321.1 ABC transporter permease [Geomesophilobacter sediminis]